MFLALFPTMQMKGCRLDFRDFLEANMPVTVPPRPGNIRKGQMVIETGTVSIATCFLGFGEMHNAVISWQLISATLWKLTSMWNHDKHVGYRRWAARDSE